jgi:hypothetical protein
MASEDPSLTSQEYGKADSISEALIVKKVAERD